MAEIFAPSDPRRTVSRVPETYVYEVMERPDVEVLVDGDWWPAELRMRTPLPGGRYRYNASWHKDGDTYLDDFDQDEVRPETVDRAAGRGPVSAAAPTVEP